jgi:Spy/CpxP family protein refolding chaperone
MRALLPCLLLLAATAVAQRAPMGLYAWWDSPVAKDLNLSADQTARVRATVREFRNRLIDLRGAVRKAELDTADAFNDDPFDLKRATEAVDRLSAARGELGRALAQLSLRLRAVLTVDQWRELQRRRPRREFSGGPGRESPGVPRR